MMTKYSEKTQYLLMHAGNTLNTALPPGPFQGFQSSACNMGMGLGINEANLNIQN